MKTTLIIAALGWSMFAGAQAPAASADKQQLDNLESSYHMAADLYKKSPSPANKHLLVVAMDKLATATMTSNALSPRVRYDRALTLYQQVLTMDKGNKEATNNAAMIDSVYRGMIAKARAKLAKDPNDKVAAAQLARFTAIYKRAHRALP